MDLIPKFAMASGEFVKFLVHTDVTRYLEFKQIAGSYVYRDGKISKVPSTEMEAISSPLMGFFEKRRFRTFLIYLNQYRQENPATHQGTNLMTTPMRDVYTKFGLEAGTQDFVGHALGLYLDDSYLGRPAKEAVDRILLYMNSMAKYGKSPYIYPLYGLGELPQSFARLSAIYGGTYMLSKPIEEIVLNADGRVEGVRSEGQVVKAKAVLCDPTYALDKCHKVGQVVRIICLLDHPIPNTSNEDSLQIVIPQNQLKRKHDIYIAVVSSEHNVCAKGKYIAIVSTIVETGVPENECQPAIQLLGPVLEKFVAISDVYEPESSGQRDGLFISRSYDATSHFETVCDDVKDIYLRLTGEPLSVEGQVARPNQE